LCIVVWWARDFGSASAAHVRNTSTTLPRPHKKHMIARVLPSLPLETLSL